MSIFKVKLNNTLQGRLDLGDTGSPSIISIQRQIYVAGPNHTYRLLKDGETFVDCNYWKKFTSEVVGDEYAFIEVDSDDGSIYSDTPAENIFSVGGTETLTTDYADTVVDFVTDHSGPARFLMVQNLDESINIIGELNGDNNVTFSVGPGESMMFNQGDLVITILRLKSASGTPNISYIASVRSVFNS